MTAEAANDSLRCTGIGRDGEYQKCLVLYFNDKPSDDDMRRVHDLVRDGAPLYVPSPPAPEASTWEASPDTTSGECTVLREDANNYCEILRLLGMEEEGDPVAAVRKLIEDDDAAQEAAVARAAPEARERFPQPPATHHVNEYEAILDDCEFVAFDPTMPDGRYRLTFLGEQA